MMAESNQPLSVHGLEWGNERTNYPVHIYNADTASIQEYIHLSMDRGLGAEGGEVLSSSSIFSISSILATRNLSRSA